jgi:hypothetical protein
MALAGLKKASNITTSKVDIMFQVLNQAMSYTMFMMNVKDASQEEPTHLALE